MAATALKHSIDTKLYHGTTESAALRALAHGIESGGVPSRTNWTQMIESHPDMVYLTRAYALFLALAAIGGNARERAAVIEVEMNKLAERDFYPDEDFIAEGLMIPPHGTIEGNRRRKEIRDQIQLYQHRWSESLEKLGNITHRRTVPQSAILRVAFFQPTSNQFIANEAAKATVRTQHYRLWGERYRRLTAWLFGRNISADEWMVLNSHAAMQSSAEQQIRYALQMCEMNKAHLGEEKWKERRTEIERWLNDRTGVEVLEM